MEHPSSGSVNPFNPDSFENSGTLLADANKAVNNRAYGSPKENHERTAALFSTYLGVPITARQVCMLNVLQKVSRDAHVPKRDNLVDIAGYADNADRV